MVMQVGRPQHKRHQNCSHASHTLHAEHVHVSCTGFLASITLVDPLHPWLPRHPAVPHSTQRAPSTTSPTCQPRLALLAPAACSTSSARCAAALLLLPLPLILSHALCCSSRRHAALTDAARLLPCTKGPARTKAAAKPAPNRPRECLHEAVGAPVARSRRPSRVHASSTRAAANSSARAASPAAQRVQAAVRCRLAGPRDAGVRVQHAACVGQHLGEVASEGAHQLVAVVLHVVPVVVGDQE